MTDITDADIKVVAEICHLTGWDGVRARLNAGWRPDPETNEGKLLALVTRHRTDHLIHDVDALELLQALEAAVYALKAVGIQNGGLPSLKELIEEARNSGALEEIIAEAQ